MTLRSGSPRIRPATAEDAVALTDLHLDCWDDAYTGIIDQGILDRFRARRTDRIQKWHLLLAEATAEGSTLLAETGPGRLVGFASAGPSGDDAPAPVEVTALYVRAVHWGAGVGHALLTEALAEQPAYLWVSARNMRAIAFYERHGFAADGTARQHETGTHLRMVR